MSELYRHLQGVGPGIQEGLHVVVGIGAFARQEDLADRGIVGVVVEGVCGAVEDRVNLRASRMLQPHA